MSIDKCRKARNSERQFVLGDNRCIDSEGNYAANECWITEEWILSRDPEWIVREVNHYSREVLALYKIEHAPTCYDLDDLIAEE